MKQAGEGRDRVLRVTGGNLRDLRRSRGWDVSRLAYEFRQAADEPLPVSLDQMIRAWEAGRYAPRERYELLYRAVFPELAAMNGTSGLAAPLPDPASVLDRARRTPAGLPALAQQAAASAQPEIAALAARLAELQQQVAEAAALLQKLLNGEHGDA